MRAYLLALLARLSALRPRNLRAVAKAAAPVVIGLVLGLWLAAPIGPLVQRVLREVQSDGIRIEVGDAGAGLTGVSLSDVRVTAPLALRFDEVTVRPRLATLWFRPGLSVVAERGDGSIDASLGISSDRDVALEIEDLDLAAVGLGEELPFGLAVSGTVRGTVDLVLPGGQPYELTGTVALEGEGMRLGLPGGLLPVEAMRLGDITIKFKADGGKIELERVAADSPDLSASLRGRVELRRPIERSLVDATLRLRFEEPLRTSVAPLLPLAGFRNEREAFVRDMRGNLGTYLGGGR